MHVTQLFYASRSRIQPQPVSVSRTEMAWMNYEMILPIVVKVHGALHGRRDTPTHLMLKLLCNINVQLLSNGEWIVLGSSGSKWVKKSRRLAALTHLSTARDSLHLIILNQNFFNWYYPAYLWTTERALSCLPFHSSPPAQQALYEYITWYLSFTYSM